MKFLLAASPLDPEMPRASATAPVREQKSHGDLPFMWKLLAWLSSPDFNVERLNAQVRWGICYGNKP
jgi:hypothetical protein